MVRFKFSQIRLGIALIFLCIFLTSCEPSAKTNSRYFGKTELPKDNFLRYISGSEPESLDPQIGTSQPEARIYMAIYDGLVEYHPKTMEPIPAIAESWEIGKDGTEYIFHLRQNAKFSDGTPITAKDFVYSFRRALSPELASRNANLVYPLKYAEAYNSQAIFVRNPDGTFLLKKDLEEASATPEAVAVTKANDVKETDSEFHKFIDSPERFTIHAQEIEANTKVKDLFKFTPTSLKSPVGLANKIKNGTDAFSKFLQSNLNQEAINACLSIDSCNDSAKQNLASELNKVLVLDSPANDENKLLETLSDDYKAFVQTIASENRARTKANDTIDKDIAKSENDAEKAEKAKKKKTLINQSFYSNRFLFDATYKDEIDAAPINYVKADNIGVEAVDDYTLRIKLYQPVPYFIGLLPHQIYRVIPQNVIEKFGKNWVKPENIVTSGAFKLSVYKPYDKIIVVRDSNYWDATNVKLDGIEFYPLEEANTMMNLYKTGNVDAMYNHVPPAAWIDEIKGVYVDEYMDQPEVATEFYVISVKNPPMDDLKVRQAFSLGIDREALSKFRKTTKPLTDFTPEGVFPKYEEARKKVQTQKLKELKISEEEWNKRSFDPEKARRLLTEAGYKIEKVGDKWVCNNFPVEKVSITYNTAESNRQIAEFVQAQWRQNLGVTITLNNQEFRTFLEMLNKVDYKGFGRRGWVGDYMDPFTFLGLFYTKANDGATGWWSQEYDNLLTKSNNELDPQKRNEIMAEAEFMVMQQQVVIPLMTQATNWMKKPYVKGLYPNPGTLHPWKFTYIERDTAKWDKNVENIMKNQDPIVEEQLTKLMSSQLEAEKRAKTASEATAETAK